MSEGLPLFCIDPGTTESGWCVMRGRRVIESGISPNHEVLERLRTMSQAQVAIEWVENFGMPVGQELFVTVRWIGRFAEACEDPETVQYVTRRAVKLHLCRSSRAKDPNVRQALLDLLGPVGTRKAPGPLYGVKSHAWSAVAVGITAQGITPMFDGVEVAETRPAPAAQPSLLAGDPF